MSPADTSDRAIESPRDVLLSRTPARVLVGRAGPAYRTSTQLELREDLARAHDAVGFEIDLGRDLDAALVVRSRLFEVSSRAASKAEFLMRPDLGRSLSEAARVEIAQRCPRGTDLQVVVGDGLSGIAVVKQVPAMLDPLGAGARARGLSLGQPFLVRHCRVGILNEVGELLNPAVVVLLIGERPGLSSAESLSAYMAYRPRPGHSDAQRNLISNIHRQGVAPEEAVERILSLADRMRRFATSGVALKEEMPARSLPGLG